MTVEEGLVYGVCWSKPPDLAIGAVGPFTASPVSAAVAPPATAPEGPVSELTITI